jgi:hypothetical protein
MTEPTQSPFQAAYDQLRTINTKDRARIMADERDLMETRKTTMALAIGNARSDIKGLEALRDELNRAIDTKTTLLNESLATFASLSSVVSDLDVQIIKLGS